MGYCCDFGGGNATECDMHNLCHGKPMKEPTFGECKGATGEMGDAPPVEGDDASEGMCRMAGGTPSYEQPYICDDVSYMEFDNKQEQCMAHGYFQKYCCDSGGGGGHSDHPCVLLSHEVIMQMRKHGFRPRSCHDRHEARRLKGLDPGPPCADHERVRGHRDRRMQGSARPFARTGTVSKPVFV